MIFHFHQYVPSHGSKAAADVLPARALTVETVVSVDHTTPTGALQRRKVSSTTSMSTWKPTAAGTRTSEFVYPSIELTIASKTTTSLESSRVWRQTTHLSEPRVPSSLRCSTPPSPELSSSTKVKRSVYVTSPGTGQRRSTRISRPSRL